MLCLAKMDLRWNTTSGDFDVASEVDGSKEVGLAFHLK